MLDAEEQWEASQLIPLGCRMLDIDNVPFFGFNLADLSAAYTCGTGMQPPVTESEVRDVVMAAVDVITVLLHVRQLNSCTHTSAQRA